MSGYSSVYTCLLLSVCTCLLLSDASAVEGVRRLRPVRRVLSRQRKAPIQLFCYADDDICVARGRSGGLAVWARTTAEWELANGIV